MSDPEERELRARVDAADANAPQCKNKHAIRGNNVYKDGVGNKSCLLCRIIRQRNARAQRPQAPSQRKATVPISPDLVRALRMAAGMNTDGVA